MSSYPEDERIRRIIREEFERIMPELRKAPAYLTPRQCATKFRLGYDRVREMVARGELKTKQRPYGKRVATLIVAEDAEMKLGPGRLP